MHLQACYHDTSRFLPLVEQPCVILTFYGKLIYIHRIEIEENEMESPTA